MYNIDLETGWGWPPEAWTVTVYLKATKFDWLMVASGNLEWCGRNQTRFHLPPSPHRKGFQNKTKLLVYFCDSRDANAVAVPRGQEREVSVWQEQTRCREPKCRWASESHSIAATAGTTAVVLQQADFFRHTHTSNLEYYSPCRPISSLQP